MISIRSNKNKSMEILFYKQLSKPDLSENLAKVQSELKAWFKELKEQFRNYNDNGQPVRVLFREIELFEQHADNVVKNEVTCRARFEEFKISRIIKKLCQTKENT